MTIGTTMHPTVKPFLFTTEFSSAKKQKRVGAVAVVVALFIIVYYKQLTTNAWVTTCEHSFNTAGKANTAKPEKEEYKHDHTNITDSSEHYDIPEVLFIVMGQASFFDTWYNNLTRTNRTIVRLSFLYGAYDSPLPPESPCQENYSLLSDDDFESCKFHFIPNTTWTQGRNILAGDALLLEKKRKKKFDFWLFLDDDVRFQCVQPELQDHKACLRAYLELLGQARELHSSKVSGIAPMTLGAQGGYLAVSTQDAMLASFRRHAVPYLLPYASPGPGGSEWLSQAALFCVMRTCFRSSIISPPNMSVADSLHRDYPRAGLGPDTILATVRNNYGNYVNLDHCEKTRYNHFLDWIGPVPTTEEIIAEMPLPNLAFCAPLLDRFAEWERRVLLLKTESRP